MVYHLLNDVTAQSPAYPDFIHLHSCDVGSSRTEIKAELQESTWDPLIKVGMCTWDLQDSWCLVVLCCPCFLSAGLDSQEPCPGGIGLSSISRQSCRSKGPRDIWVLSQFTVNGGVVVCQKYAGMIMYVYHLLKRSVVTVRIYHVQGLDHLQGLLRVTIPGNDA